MSDPNLCRLLDASHASTDGMNHWVLRKEYTLATEERMRTYETIAKQG
jgi:hypothetical protein